MFGYYKKLFTLTLKSEFAEISEFIARPDEESNISIKDFKKMIKEYESDGNIDFSEMSKLQEEVNNIEGETKIELQNLLNDIMTNPSFNISEDFKVGFGYKSKTPIIPIMLQGVDNKDIENKIPVIDNKSTKEESNDNISDLLNREKVIKKLVENESSLNYNEEEKRVYIKLITPNGENHRGFFTLSKNPNIKDKYSLEAWKIQITDKLNKKYSQKEDISIENKELQDKNSLKVESLIDEVKGLNIGDINDQSLTYYLKDIHLSTSKPLRALTVEEKRLILTTIIEGKDLPVRQKSLTKESLEFNRKVIGTINLPTISKDVNGVYKKIESSLLETQQAISIDGALINGIPDKIDDNGYYKLIKGEETVFVTGERLRKILKIEDKKGESNETSDLSIDDLGIDFSKLEDSNVEEDDVSLSNGKVEIDIDGLGDSLILEKKGDKFTITNNGSEISDIIIEKNQITDAIIFLNKIVQGDILHNASKKLQSLGYKKTELGDKIKKYIDNIKTPSRLEKLVKNTEELKVIISNKG